jgi:hypothetical protein
MDWKKYSEQLDNIVEDLLLNKEVLVVCQDTSFGELQDKLLEIYEDLGFLNLSFCQSANIENDFYKENFDAIYVLN